MKIEDRSKRFLSVALGVGFTVLCGLVLSKAPVGEAWINASYDYLFRFGSRSVTNNVVVIFMDNEAYAHYHQIRGQAWDRSLHASLLSRLKEDRAALVVIDSFFRRPGDSAVDELLASSMREQSVVLMAEQTAVIHPELRGAYPNLPSEPFLSAAGTNWGVAWLDPDMDSIVRRHWPFPSPGPYPSLPWTAARLAGARVEGPVTRRWLRYYKADAAWISLGYRLALAQPTNYFRDKIVFIGNKPKTSIPGDEPDEFQTPFTRWNGESMAGVEIMATSFLNLLGKDWLERSAWWVEALIFVGFGVFLGWGFYCLRPFVACGIAAAVTPVIMLGAISWSHSGRYWFPWLVVVGGQIPFALVWTLAAHRIHTRRARPEPIGVPSRTRSTPRKDQPQNRKEDLPDTPGYDLLSPPFGQGAYGDVWLARNPAGQWRALKIVYLESFRGSPEPYQREFKGINRYQPISEKHPSLLRVEFVSRMLPDGWFFYVMELGDSIEAGWEGAPATYRPRDLVSECRRMPGHRLPVRECVRIGLALADVIGFLHRHGLTHRDIKPQNVIFVNGRPKLADMGLIADIRPPDQPASHVGTPGYMPPPPETPGTPQADIYALGMMLYVLSTGRTPALFPELSATIAETDGYLRLNAIILKACNPDCTERYLSAEEMHRALLEAHELEETPKM